MLVSRGVWMRGRRRCAGFFCTESFRQALAEPWARDVLASDIDDIPLHGAARIGMQSMGRGWLNDRIAFHVYVDGIGLDRGSGVPAWAVVVLVGSSAHEFSLKGFFAGLVLACEGVQRMQPSAEELAAVSA